MKCSADPKIVEQEYEEYLEPITVPQSTAHVIVETPVKKNDEPETNLKV